MINQNSLSTMVVHHGAYHNITVDGRSSWYMTNVIMLWCGATVLIIQNLRLLTSTTIINSWYHWIQLFISMISLIHGAYKKNLLAPFINSWISISFSLIQLLIHDELAQPPGPGLTVALPLPGEVTLPGGADGEWLNNAGWVNGLVKVMISKDYHLY